MDIGVSAFVFSYHSIGKKALFVATVKIMMMLTVCSSILINDFTGLNTMIFEHNGIMIFVLLGLWITHCETPLLLHS